jgi:hypothetical protein
MGRRFKPRVLEGTLPPGSDLGKWYFQLPDGRVTTDPGRAVKWRKAGQEVRCLPRLGNARLGPLITEDWPDGWPAPPQ